MGKRDIGEINRKLVSPGGLICRVARETEFIERGADACDGLLQQSRTCNENKETCRLSASRGAIRRGAEIVVFGRQPVDESESFVLDAVRWPSGRIPGESADFSAIEPPDTVARVEKS